MNLEHVSFESLVNVRIKILERKKLKIYILYLKNEIGSVSLFID